MAHIIHVPLSIEFASQRRPWEVFWCEIAGLRDEFLPKGSGIFAPIDSISGKRDLAIRVHKRDIGAMLGIALNGRSEERNLFTMHGPDVDDYLKRRFAPDGKITTHEDVGDSLFEIVACFGKAKGQPRQKDPWEMRDEFLGLKNTNAALTRFLTKWGDWDSSFLFDIPPGDSLLGGQESPRFVIPELVWERQRFYKAAIAGSAEDWMANYGRVPTPTRLSTHPFLQTIDSTCSMAIETTITMDKLRDIPYRLCALKGCGKPFRLKTKHDKLYCSAKCAHHASVKRGREAKRAARTKQGGKERHVNLQAR
jgi:hypothetical protein